MENKEHGISRSTTMRFLAQHNYPIPLFLEQDIVFFDNAVLLIVHMSALSLSTGAFRRAHHVHFTVTNFRTFPFPYKRKCHRPSGFAIGNPGQSPVHRLVMNIAALIQQEHQDDFSRATRTIAERVEKCIEVDGGMFEHLI